MSYHVNEGAVELCQALCSLAHYGSAEEAASAYTESQAMASAGELSSEEARAAIVAHYEKLLAELEEREEWPLYLESVANKWAALGALGLTLTDLRRGRRELLEAELMVAEIENARLGFDFTATMEKRALAVKISKLRVQLANY